MQLNELLLAAKQICLGRPDYVETKTQPVSPSPELAGAFCFNTHFNANLDFVTIGMGKAGASSDRKLRSGSFMGCSGWLMVNNVNHDVLMIHMFPSDHLRNPSSLSHIPFDLSLPSWNEEIRPNADRYFEEAERLGAKVSLVKVMGKYAADNTHLFVGQYGRRIHQIVKIQVNGRSKVWDLLYDPLSREVYTKNSDGQIAYAKIDDSPRVPVPPHTRKGLANVIRAAATI